MKISCMAKPFYIGNVQIKNRFAVTAMVTNMCDAGGYATEQYTATTKQKQKAATALSSRRTTRSTPMRADMPESPGSIRKT